MGEDSLPMVLLLYVHQRLGWTFAHANYLLALGEGVQLLFLVILLPLVIQILLSRLRLSPYAKDFSIAQTSTILLAIGTLLVGIGPTIPVIIPGILFMSMAAGLQSMLRSLITETISAKDISVVYSVVTILHVFSSSLAGPLYTGAFAAGLRLGTQWTGLPFIIAGAFSALAISFLFFVAQKHQYEGVPSNDPEE
ncbi:MAG: hypothetical protein M1818_001038 [Claussenomyces sp. TS43310]|nr:MAG: hypothetical protein M1818_001038 [Claussenomyces sp. TS43310]